MIKRMKHLNFKLIDFVPAISGLIGKIALASSFAFVWAQELGITHNDFVFQNVRVEILIGSIITLIAAILFPDASPPGTLAPLIVLVPTMSAFGVHPLVLGISVGLIGIVAVKTGIFNKLVGLSGFVSKTSITLSFGIAGVLLSAEKLYSFFRGKPIAFLFLIIILTTVYAVLLKNKKMWLIIPIASVVSLILPYFFGLGIHVLSTEAQLNLNPSYWWNDLWGIGYGFDYITILKTLPFAIFVILLWTIDTVSIQTLQDASHEKGQVKNEININRSFIIVSIRNIVGSCFGGAQTGSLWRSFLIPLFMVKRPMGTCAILLGVFGILSSITAVPIKIMSYTPLVWSVLLFGIFMPFTVTAISNIMKADKLKVKSVVVFFSLFGIFINPMLTWIISLFYEKVLQRNKK